MVNLDKFRRKFDSEGTINSLKCGVLDIQGTFYS